MNGTCLFDCHHALQESYAVSKGYSWIKRYFRGPFKISLLFLFIEQFFGDQIGSCVIRDGKRTFARKVEKSRKHQAMTQMTSDQFILRRAKTLDVFPTRAALFGVDTVRLDVLCVQLRKLKMSPLHLHKSSFSSDTWHSSFEMFAQCCFVDEHLFLQEKGFSGWYLHLRAQHPNVPMVLFREECREVRDDSVLEAFDSCLLSDYRLSDLEWAINQAFDQNCVTRLAAALRRI